MPPTAQAGGAGEEEDEDFNEPLEDEAEESEDSDQDDYTAFTPAEVLSHLYEYKSAYHTVRRHRNVAEARVAEFSDKYEDLQHTRDTQAEFVQVVQDECDIIKHNTEAYRQCSECQMNEEQVAHQSKVLEFNEQSKVFAAHKKQFEADEVQTVLHEAEWKQKENNEQLRRLQHV